MDAKKCEKIYDKLYGNLEIVFGSKEILMQLSDENFKDLILNQISILNFLEKELPTSVLLKKNKNEKEIEDRMDAKAFLDKLNTILSSSKDFLNLDFTKESDIEDEVNYLSVYIKNTFKKNLSDFKKNINETPESVKAEFTNSTPNNTSANSANNPVYNNIPPMGNGGMGSPMGGPGFGPFPFGNGAVGDPNYFQEQMLFQLANEKLRQDINTGNFYMYKTKPKVVPILKKIMGILCVAYILLTLIAVIMSSISSGHLSLSASFLYNMGLNTNGSSLTLSQLSNIYYSSIFIQIVAIFLAIYFSYIMLARAKNENAKYTFMWQQMIYLFILIFFLIIDNITSFPQSFVFISYFHGADGSSINAGNESWIGQYESSVYIQTAAYCILGLLIFIGIATLILAPKVDKERMTLKVQEYISEMKKPTSRI